MTRRAVLFIISLAVLVAAAPAAAKKLDSAAVCGPSGCKDVKNEKALAQQLGSGLESPGPTAAAAYYRVRLTFRGDGESHTSSAYYVPSAHAFAFRDGTITHWSTITSQAARRTLDDAASRVAAFPAAGLRPLLAVPTAQVSETFAPTPRPAATDDGDGFPWLIVVGALAAFVLLITALTMRRRRPSAVTTAALFVVAFAVAAVPAVAKEIKAATVCGASGCHDVSGKKTLAALVDGGEESPPPASRAPFYRLRLTIDGGDQSIRIRADYVPSLGLLRINDSGSSVSRWGLVDPKARKAFALAIGNEKPFAASKLEIVDEASLPTAAQVSETFSPAQNAAPTSSSDDGGFPWVITIAGLGALFVLAMTLVRRRRPRTVPQT